MKKLILVALLFSYCTSWAQVRIAFKIDTTLQINKSLCNFINRYMDQDTISNALWHPKYRDKLYYNYTTDQVWRTLTPRQIAQKFTLELSELQTVNDTLAYFTLLAQNKPDRRQIANTTVYKYYIVKVKGKFYLDNCKDYDFKQFSVCQTKNIVFYISPSYQVQSNEMMNASAEIDSLCGILNRPVPKKPIEYYMCANEDELNNLANIILGAGRTTGYTNSQDGIVAGINSNPSYKHEFVHTILGLGGNCFFLQEGMAMLYGGGNQGKTSYQQGIVDLRKCYNSGGCTFDNLYVRKSITNDNSLLLYTFAAACCEYLIKEHGLTFLYQLYDDKSVTTENFLDKVVQKTGTSRQKVKAGIEKLIL